MGKVIKYSKELDKLERRLGKKAQRYGTTWEYVCSPREHFKLQKLRAWEGHGFDLYCARKESEEMST
jgi:hypothetical protein